MNQPDEPPNQIPDCFFFCLIGGLFLYWLALFFLFSFTDGFMALLH